MELPRSSMNVYPSKKDIEDIAIELSTEPVFLEKDWHVSRIVDALSHPCVLVQWRKGSHLKWH